MTPQPSRGNPAYLCISSPLLAEALHLPAGTEITGADWDMVWNRLRVFVKHPDIRPTPEGVPLLRIDVMITEFYHDCGHKTHKGEWAGSNTFSRATVDPSSGEQL